MADPLSSAPSRAGQDVFKSAPPPKPPSPAKLTLTSALTEARTALQLALRQLNANGTPDTDPTRLSIETAFENANNEVTGKHGTHPTLAAAASHLEVAVTLLANQSGTPGHLLQELRGAASLARKRAAELDT